jgi:hypothetical protein
MIRLVARTRALADGPSWLVIEGDDAHGYLVRSFKALDVPQLSDDWVEDLADAYGYGERCGIARDDWRPRQEPLPGAQSFPDLDAWTPDNSGYE